MAFIKLTEKDSFGKPRDEIYVNSDQIVYIEGFKTISGTRIHSADGKDIRVEESPAVVDSRIREA